MFSRFGFAGVGNTQQKIDIHVAGARGCCSSMQNDGSSLDWLDTQVKATGLIRPTARKGTRLTLLAALWAGRDVHCIFPTRSITATQRATCFGCAADAPPDATGAESLTDREWESLLLYSYSLRKVAVDDTNLVHARLSDDEEGPEKQEEHVWGGSAGVGLWGARGLRGIRADIVRNKNSKHARRPSSAPVGRRDDKELSRRRQRVSHRPTIAGDVTTPTNGRGSEAGDVRKSLVS